MKGSVPEKLTDGILVTAVHYGSGAHFTNDFSNVIQIRRQIGF